jgi:hypothetical protein
MTRRLTCEYRSRFLAGFRRNRDRQPARASESQLGRDPERIRILPFASQYLLPRNEQSRPDDARSASTHRVLAIGTACMPNVANNQAWPIGMRRGVLCRSMICITTETIPIEMTPAQRILDPAGTTIPMVARIAPARRFASITPIAEPSTPPAPEYVPSIARCRPHLDSLRAAAIAIVAIPHRHSNVASAALVRGALDSIHPMPAASKSIAPAASTSSSAI